MVKLFVFVSSWWQHSANLASYEQQDAHEFFISMLDAIHEKEGITKNGSKGIEILILGFSSAILLSHMHRGTVYVMIYDSYSCLHIVLPYKKIILMQCKCYILTILALNIHSELFHCRENIVDMSFV